MDTDLLRKMLLDVRDEVILAGNRFPAFRSEHEGIAIIEEEFLELREGVFVKSHSTDYKYVEARQLAAMAIRFMMLVVGGEK